MDKSLILLLFSLLAQFKYTEPDDSYSNILRMGAVLNAASFNKHLQNEVSRQLYIPKITKLLSVQPTSVLTFDINLLDEFSQILDLSFSNISQSLPLLDSSLSSKSYNAPSCNSILDAIRFNSKQVCSIPYTYSSHSKQSSILNPDTSKAIFRRQFAYTHEHQYEFPSEFLSSHSKLHWSAILKEKLKQTFRNVIILLDIGSISLDSQLETMKAAARHLLDISLPSDFYSILIIDSSSTSNVCAKRRHSSSEKDLIPINSRNLKKLQLAINDLRRNYSSNSSSSHAFALEKAYDLLSQQKNVLSATNIIQYISRGKLEELSDASNVLRHLAVTVLKYKFRVKINTIIITDGTGSPLLWPAEFMESIALQNFSRYRYSLNSTIEKQLFEVGYKAIRGESILLNKPIPLALSLEIVEKLLKPDEYTTSSSEASWHMQPKAYGRDEEQTATVTRTILDDRGFLIYGIDVSIHEIAWNIFNHNHVLYSPPSTVLEVFITIDQGYIVTSSSGFSNIYIHEADDWHVSSQWLLDASSAEQGDMEVISKNHKKLFYYWKKLKTKPFVIFIRTVEKHFPFTSTIPSTTVDREIPSSTHLIFNHRHKTHMMLCFLNGESYNFEYAMLFLPISIYPLGREPIHRSNLLFASDVYDFEEKELNVIIQQEINILALITRFWINEIGDKEIPVIRRFVASRRGVLAISPASRIANRYEPLKQKWFQEAIKNEGKVIASGPYLKAYLGEVIILSTTISFPSNGSIFGVVGIEVPSAYFRLLLSESLPLCSQARRCVLFTNTGSIIYASDDHSRARVSSDVLERFHISHQEPMLTSQMIRDPSLVRRSRCRTETGIHRYFEWQSHSKRVHSSPCGSKSDGSSLNPVQHEILALSNSNLFIGMINTTCNRSSATVFCPCSVNDHRCLICGRFSEHECECPCECSVNELCSSSSEIEISIPFCPVHLREDRLSLEISDSSDMNSCEQTSCSAQLHINTCLAQAGCSWCEFDSKGTRLPIGSCLPISICYQGVHGRTTIKSMDRLEQWGLATPFGPFAAGILTIFLVVALLFYCYRAQVSGLTARRSFSDGAPLFNGHTNFDGEYDGTVFKEEKQCVQLASFEREAPPPQNPNRNVDSDHGYSTMTDRNTINEETESSTSFSTDRPRLSINALSRDKPCPTYITTAAIIHPEPQGSLIA